MILNSSSQVLITGSTGFVGGALVERLRLAGVPLLLVRKLNIAAAEMAYVSTVIHLAARVHVMHDSADDPLAAFRAVNLDATLELASQAAAVGARRLSTALASRPTLRR